MHALLYAGLAVLIMIAFERPSTKSSLGLVLVTTLIVGGLQEGWQVLSGVQILRWNTVFDLGVDMLGALIGYGLFYWFRIKSSAY